MSFAPSRALRPLLTSFALFSAACAVSHDGADDATGTSGDELSVETSKNPGPGEFVGAFASPTIVRVGDVDHAFFAKQNLKIGGAPKTFNIPHATFSAGRWSLPHEVLPKLGRGAKPEGPVWAPAAAEISPDHWMIYYTAEVLDPASQKKCIWRAHASRPEGPFVDDFDGPIVCQDGHLWSLDAYVVRDAQGDWNLAARIDLGNEINSIQIRRLGPFGEHFDQGSEWHLLAKNEPGSWDQHVMENPGIVRLAPPNGKMPHWFVFYSARRWQDDSYSIGYADCGENIYGLAGNGCRKITSNEPWFATNSDKDVYGPGTPTFYNDASGSKMMSIQAWRYDGGVTGPNKAKNRQEGQTMRTYSIHIDDQYRPHVALKRVDL